MNCKQGDLAIIIGCTKGQEWSLGKIVNTIQYLEWYGENAWFIRPKLVNPNGVTCDAALDEYLRPISGLPMEEETEQKLKEPA